LAPPFLPCVSAGFVYSLPRTPSLDWALHCEKMAGMGVTNPLSVMNPLSQQGQGLSFVSGGFQQPSSGFGQQQPAVGGQMGQPMPSPGAGFGQPQGSMGSMGSMQPGSFPPAGGYNPSAQSDYDYENEPPLLEELGINPDHIWQRVQGVAFFKKLDQDLLADADLSGPLVIAGCLGMALLLAGKMQFGYIYGFGGIGCLGICLLINVMSQRGGIDLYRTMSILGYGLIPIVLLATVGIVFSLKSAVGSIISMLCIFWATATSSRFFATAIAMQEQRWLVAYPVGLVYTCFTLITVF